MRPLHILTAMLFIAACLTGLQRIHQVDRTDRAAKKAPTRRAMAQPSWRGLHIQLPAGWVRLQAGSDYAVWSDPARHHTLTIGIAPREPRALAEVARSALAEAASTLPDLQPVAAPQRQPDGRVLVAFRTGPPGRRLSVLQCFERPHGARHDLISTFTSSDGRWPTPAPGPPLAPA